MSRINVLDLFSGAGGFSLGFHLAGVHCIGAIEMDRFAAQTYKHNFPKTPIYERDMADFTEGEIVNIFSGADIIVAGPPCQGFSVAGPSQYGKIDDRNQLLLQVARFAKLLKPSICVVENVKGLLHGKLPNNMKALQIFMDKMESIGYNTSYQVLQAADFGVPQWRERLFIFAMKSRKTFPKMVRKFGSKDNPWITVSQAIMDLPLIGNGEGADKLVSYDKEPTSSFQLAMRKHSKGVANHVSMQHTKRLLERFQHIPIGGSLVDVPPEFGQRLRNGNQLDYRMRFKMNNQRLDPEKVSLAITASFQSNFVHPFLDRNLTAREGARLQSFPDRFIFLGPRTLMSKSLLFRENRLDEIGLSQYNQIGNAVPPSLAKEIAKTSKQLLEIADE